jgi:hypothetical protein
MNMKQITIILGIGLALGLWVACDRHSGKSGANGDQYTAQDVASATEDRRQWILQSLLADYNRMGKKNARWDKVTRDALASYAQLASCDEQIIHEIRPQFEKAVTAALDAGSDELMIQYLSLRLPQIVSSLTLEERTQR